jgi:hypothetical protein
MVSGYRVPGDQAMRIFFTACIAAAVIAVVGALALSAIQKPVDVAFATEAVRI